ncbi:MAG TPA: hypothetical protein GX497_17390 [Bacillus bacterium]|nr:hypothetical protein [Bacillus sp. (in: firmicutes)]
MYGMIIAIILFNIIAFKTNKKLTSKQIAHIWVFTIALQMCVDAFVDAKYHGYWYFTKEIDWAALPAHIALVPPVNMMFLNWFPFDRTYTKKFLYILFWEMSLLLYEFVTMLPEPWGYFHYGWWNIWISAAINPILLLSLVFYYKKFIMS